MDRESWEREYMPKPLSPEDVAILRRTCPKCGDCMDREERRGPNGRGGTEYYILMICRVCGKTKAEEQ